MNYSLESNGFSSVCVVAQNVVLVDGRGALPKDSAYESPTLHIFATISTATGEQVAATDSVGGGVTPDHHIARAHAAVELNRSPQMILDRSVPGRATVADWDPEPTLPFTLEDCVQWRDDGRFGSCSLSIVDSVGQRYHFFFDRILSRLCHGSALEEGDDAAFISPGSRVESMLIEFLSSQCSHPDFGPLLANRLRLAAAYTGQKQGEQDVAPQPAARSESNFSGSLPPST